MNIEVLDCTLRDGGYVNDWNFGYDNIQKIINNLILSKIQFIECGFLKKNLFNRDFSLFNSFEALNEFPNNSKLGLMLNFGEFDEKELLELNPYNFFLRIAFKKEDFSGAMSLCEVLIKNGFKIFINPMNTISYNDIELLNLIEFANKIKPFVLTIVDTMGQMNKKETLLMFYLFDKNLNSDIAIGYHSHNALALSFSNVQCLLEQKSDRSLIIDSTLFGMGRGAGNLSSELLIQYLNDNYEKDFDSIPILKSIQESINPIFDKSPWGYSIPYRIAALNSCHPNYAKLLIEKKVDIEIIDKILKKIPEEKKASFDKKILENIM
ncbi:MAG: hypothetical protein IJB79_05865 [Candidatus Gastranaerophilales bacterium]|nr:hypothetical protein [Candidatus Gastranaerophilales bacterium]